MVTISRPFVVPGHPAYEALSGLPEVASLIARLRDTFQVLSDSQSADDVRAGALQQEVTALEAEYQELSKGIDYMCRALAILAEQEESRGRWQRLREVLLPSGSGRGSASSAQACVDNAALQQQIFEGLPAQDKSLLRGHYVGKRNLFEIVERWLALGTQIGQKELERQSVPVTPPDSTLQEARNQWARIVGSMVAMFHMSELLGELSAGIKDHFLAPLRAATGENA
jgi:hypothetical protein